jgi:hypothetical protein
LLLLIGIGFSGAYNFRPPPPLGSDAPAQQFSAARARSELVHLFATEAPHPMGSGGNTRRTMRRAQATTAPASQRLSKWHAFYRARDPTKTHSCLRSRTGKKSGSGVVLSVLRPLVHRIGFWNRWFAPWWVWNLLLLAQAWFVPLTTHVMLPAALATGGVTLLLAFSHRLDRPAVRCAAAALNALVVGYFLLPLVHVSEIVQGWTFAPLMFVPLALLATTVLPLLDRGRVMFPFAAALVAIIAGWCRFRRQPARWS